MITLDGSLVHTPFLLKETQAIAIGESGSACNGERVAAHLLHLAHILTEGLGGVERGDVALATLQQAVFVAMGVQEIICEAAIEGLAQVGFESIGDAAL